MDESIHESEPNAESIIKDLDDCLLKEEQSFAANKSNKRSEYEELVNVLCLN